MYIAKAITAFIVVAVSLFVSDHAASGIDMDLLEGTIISILTALGVYAVPNSGARRVR